MAYIGNPPITGNFQVCDAISVVNGQAAYTMQVSSANVSPESANHMLVSLNGVLQKPGSSFTISGSTITFASNLATGDVIDFIILLGNVLDLGVPSDATVTDAKANFVSTSSAAGLQIKGDGTTDGTLQLNCSQNSHGIKLKSPAHSAGASYTLTFPTTDGNNEEFLQTNGSGVLTWAEAGGGAYKKLVTTTVSSGVSEVAFNSTYITSTYNDYMVIISDLKSANETAIKLQFSDDNGSSTKSDYDYIVEGTSSDGTRNQIRATSGASAIDLTRDLRAQSDANAWIEVHLNGLSSTAQASHATWQCGFEDNSNQANVMHGNGYDPETTATNYIRFFMNSGNITLGKFTLYGRSV